VLLVNLSCPLGSAAMVSDVELCAPDAGALDDAELEEGGAAAFVEELLLELPQAARLRASIAVLRIAAVNLSMMERLLCAGPVSAVL
jgi:hypothetical protein